MITKILLVIAVTILIVFLLRNAGRRGELPRKRAATKVEDMVRCQVCGVNLPRSEALMSRGRFYCGEAHRRQDAD